MKKRIRSLATLLMLLVFVGVVNAQQKTVTGTVTDTQGEPIIGASVVAKGTDQGTITNLDGKFTLNINASVKTITVRYVGMKSQNLKVTSTPMKVVLQESSQSLNDIVVIGYGTARKKDLTGSVATVKGSDIMKVPVSNVAEALEGKMAGVHMTTTDGSPDAEVLIRVRGGGSITGDNSPLYIVDGFPVSSISDIPSTEIQDITVLRDASSTAIYGSRGANGVILITTKSAKGGKTKVTYNSFVQTKSVAKRLQPMDTYDYVMSNYEYALLRGTTALNSFEQNFGVYDDLSLYKSIKPIDWQGDMFGANVLSQQQNLSVSGGTEKTNFLLSGTYDYNSGLMVNNDYGRYAFQFKLNHQLAKNLVLRLNTRVRDQVVNGSGTQGGTYKIRTSQAITAVATRGLSDFTAVDTSTMTDQEYQDYLNSTLTLSQQAQRYWKRKNYRSFDFNLALDWTIIKGLIAHVEAGYGYGFNEQKRWWGATTSNASYAGGLPLADWNKTNTTSKREAATLTYDFKIQKVHHFNVMVGEEVSSDGSNYNYMYNTGYSTAYTPEQVFSNFGLGTGIPNVNSYVSPDTKLASAFGRLNYSYMDKYLLTLTMREDGSSKFADGHHWGYFPAAAFAWRVVEEPFMAPTKNWLSNLKLRLSYGEAGNNRISSSLYVPTYSLNGGSKRYGVGDVPNNHYQSSTTLSNPDLTWETTVTRDLGFDFGFLNERYNGTVDLYWNTARNLLIPHSVTAPGYTKVYENTAQTSSKGLEFSFNAGLVRKKDFTFDVNFNIGFNKTIVDALAHGLESMPFASGWASTDNKNQEDYIVKVGDPIGLVYGWKNEGYYKTTDFKSYDPGTGQYVLKDGVATTSLLGGAIGIRPGTMKLADLNGDGVVDSKDLTVIGNTNPLFQGGFGFNSTFHGFDMAANFTFTYGNQIYNANKIASTQQYRSGSYPNMLNIMRQSNSYSYMNPETGKLMTSLADLAKYNEGANAKEYWSPYSVGYSTIIPTDWAMEDGSFLRLQSLTIGYTLPKKLITKLRIQNLRVFTTATNLFVLTNYSGYDPEVSSYVRNSSYSSLTPGIDYSSYPKSRGYTFGINITL